jgi:hypothetical protein
MLEQLNQQQMLIVVGISLGIALFRAYIGFEKSKSDFDFIHYMQTVKYYLVATIPVLGALAVEQIQSGGELSIITLVLSAAGAGTLGEIMRVSAKKTILSNETVEPLTATTASGNSMHATFAANWTGPGENPTDVSDLHYDQLKANVNNEGRIYQNNFIQGKTGNKLPYGQNLKIKIDGASMVSGRLLYYSANGPIAVQIEQSGTPHNPWPDMVKFEMIDRINGKDVFKPKGAYQIVVWYLRNGREGRFTDEFEIE